MNNNLLTYKQFSPMWLFHFQQLYLSQNFTEAALKLNISQQTLSKNIQSLEKFLGTNLFERNNKNVTLLPSAHILYQNLPHLLAPLKTLNQLKNNTKKQIKIGIEPFWSRNFFPEILARLLLNWPDIEIEVFSLTQAQLLSFMHLSAFDIILTLQIPDTNCVYQALPSIHWVLAASPHCIAQGLPYAYLEYLNLTHTDPWALPQILRQSLAFEVSTKAQIDSVPLLKSLLLQNTGCAWMIESEIRAEVRAEQLKILQRLDKPMIQPYVILLNTEEAHPLIRDIVKQLNETMAKQ